MSKQYTTITCGDAAPGDNAARAPRAAAAARTPQPVETKQAEKAAADSSEPTPAAAAAEGAQAAVAYRLERIAEELRNTSTEKPRVLVMTQGRNSKRMLAAISQAGMRTIIPATGDRRIDVSPKLAHGTSPLGLQPSRELLVNAHAVLNCAAACQARAVFLCEGSTPLAFDERFAALAARQKLRVFTALNPDMLALGWVECVASADTPQDAPTWRTCHKCKLTFEQPAFTERGHACPSCGTLTRMSSAERIEELLDANTFEEWDAEIPDADPLDFPGYADKLAAQRAKTGLAEAVRTGAGTIDGFPVAVGFMDSGFFMGSMGSAVGEKVSRLFDRATEHHLPVVLFCASGGARMQEGLVSLMQMAKTSCAIERHDRAGLLYVSVLTDPTTGGVTASFATLGDIILAEPGALIGFAGQRVIRDTIKQELPAGFQTAEFALEHGLIDAIVKREAMRPALRNILALHAPACRVATDEQEEAAQKSAKGAAVTQNLVKRGIAERLPLIRGFVHDSVSSFDLERRAKRDLKRAGLAGKAAPGSAWESVQLARNVHRPTAQRYLAALADGFIELHGDRAFADDAAIIGGIGWVDGRPATIIAQEKGSDLADRIRRNFGCPQPEGYRKSLRLMKQAEKFSRPVICLVDTQGAFCGTEAEERGQGNAIAENLAGMAGLRVPVVSVLLGEGGSGGALALAVANYVAMQEHAVYSVLSPEGFASILWKDRSRAPEAAEAMRMSAVEVHRMGIVDEVVPEGGTGAHANPDQAVEQVCACITGALDELAQLTAEELIAQRQERFARF